MEAEKTMNRPLVRYFLATLAGIFVGALLLLALLWKFPFLSGLILDSAQMAGERKPIPLALDLNKGKQEKESAIPAPSAQESDEDFFSPFLQFHKLQEEMEKEMLSMRAGIPHVAKGARQQIISRVEADAVIYEITGVEGGSLSTSVENGYLTISGETKKQSGNSSFRSRFTQSFSLPEDVDPTKMETLSEKDKVVLRFPKRKS